MTEVNINYNKIRNPQLKKWLEEEFHDELFDTSDGHDHDGTNSKTLSPAAVVENDAITTVKIQDDAVTKPKIADNAVSSAEIQAGAVTATELATDAVETLKINDDAVDKDKINADVAGDGLDQNQDGSLELDVDDATVEVDVTDGLQVKALGIDTAQLAADAVETAKIKDVNVTTGKLADNAVTSDKANAEFMKVAVEDLTSGDADAYALAWQNPESSKVIVHRVILDVTTAGGTDTAEIDVGTASGAEAASDNLIDGADADAIAVYDNIDDQGTNGESKQKMDEKNGTTDYITAQIKTANAASLAGKAYIYYTAIPS